MDFYTPERGVPIYLKYGEMPARRAWVAQVVGWVPVYLKGVGNGCVVYGADGLEMVVGRDARWVRRQIAAFHCISYDEMRKEFARLYDKTQCAPLIVAARGLVFFAVKARTKLRGRNDGATGYLANTAVDEVESLGPQASRISLIGGRTLDVPMSKAAVLQRMAEAEAFWVRLHRQHVW
ncbi:MAG: hypothetical protein K6T63_04160 [Alicyclobacillus herbarius]|uniref:hypothetical protein n=1 Tax=Alicyclobacillus herbarius TaxID=122960 RepID=UPI0003F5545F|nr:hypothetical protein [Alicyclobacillus herbarius]MCL6631806.1 hypothetical protein [Alicyclobacillus herbarius]